MMKSWKSTVAVGLGLGQLLSLLLTFTGFASSQLSKKGFVAPVSQCALTYLLLALFYGRIVISRRHPPKGMMWWYYILAFVDLIAKMNAIIAYQLSSLTSVMLLDCWTIPCVILLSMLFFKTKYGLKKLIGVAICVAGLVIVVFSDFKSAPPRRIDLFAGDLSVIMGATVYGVSNVYEEYFLKEADRVELLALLGLFGLLITGYQITTDESIAALKSIFSSPEAAFLFIGYSLAMFLFYSGVPLLLKISGSTMLSLSLLTSNMWAVLIQIFAYHEKVDWMYFVAFAAVTLGLIAYSWGDVINPNCNEAASTDEEVGLGHSYNVGILDKDGSMISFQGARNSLCYILCINNFQDSSGQCVEMV